MGNNDRPDLSGRDDWRVRVCMALGAAVCMGGALMLGPVIGIEGFWPGMLAITMAIIVGIVLGQLLGVLLFRRSASGPPDHPPKV